MTAAYLATAAVVHGRRRWAEEEEYTTGDEGQIYSYYSDSGQEGRILYAEYDQVEEEGDEYSQTGAYVWEKYVVRKTAAAPRRRIPHVREEKQQPMLRRTHALAAGRTGTRHQQPETREIETEVDGDAGFLKKLAQFRANLFYEGDKLDRILDSVLAQEPATPEVHMTTVPVAKWLPIECKVMPLQLKKERVIHSGRRNTVYEMVDPSTGKRYAYKTFQKPDEYTAEINFNMFSRHPFIAKAVCIQPLEDQAGIVFELVDGMSSMAYVRRPECSQADLIRISAQLLLAMEYVHWLGFVHADLKPENVMIDRHGNIKVIDFGFAIPLPFFKTNRGTPTTIAPELVQAVNGPVHEGIDWWAYASTLGIWHGLQVNRSKSRKFVPVRVDRSEGITFGRIPSEFPDDLRQLMYIGLAPNPDRRKFNTKRQLDFLKHMPYFRKFVWPDVPLY